MARPKGSRSLRSGSATNREPVSPTADAAPPNAGVTREELDAVVAGLHQQLET